jgi:predicted DNA-binding transcriptional regulator YafY
MYHPTSRVLTVLELLQARPSITGRELAARLETDIRTVRRYITHLKDVGIPIEATIGRYGGYRLRPGFKLPPLLFSEEEALVILLGLLANPWLEIEQSAVAVEGALAKISRVLPLHARERLHTIAEQLVYFVPHLAARADLALLITLSDAIRQQRRIAMSYRSHADELTQRQVEPYGIVGLDEHWYLVGYCRQRQAHRMFRLDRIQEATALSEPFMRPEGFDCRTYVMERFATKPVRWTIAVEFQAPLYTVQQRIPASYGQLSTTLGGTLFESDVENLDGQARYLVSLNLPFVVLHPPDLRDALRRLADQIVLIASSSAAST